MGIESGMLHREGELVLIGQPVKMPTIREFLEKMADEQGKDIERLKREALGTERRRQRRESPSDEISPDPWQIHPVRKQRKGKLGRSEHPGSATPS
jgi:hypothetical protein